eukprot:CAMPEP_0172468022 /NCGR_PEP_ID=MMETSP1065-20121228/60454_1 /TAXON_ID=265537 /ORGANISM="Amphiprora paludosa, Strain CCMP125" /LENGTH=57 /DNA_ID=CAMNT_0013225335 /DNA_START=47 /DNA_END=217 /DNA_ORIENTATION=+
MAPTMQLENIPRGPPGPGSDGDVSVATTMLASEVGSVMLRTKDAYRRSVTLYKEEEG